MPTTYATYRPTGKRYSVAPANFGPGWILWLDECFHIVSKHATRGQARWQKRRLDWIAGNKRKP